MFSKIIISSAVLFMFSGSLHAQKISVVGFYNATRPEVASQLLLMPNHEYVFYISYGAVDQFSTGTWREDGNKVVIKEKKVTVDPIVIYAGNKPETKNQSSFTFRDFGRTKGIAFSYEDVNEPNSLKLLFTEGQANSKRKNELLLNNHQYIFFALPNETKANDQYQILEFDRPVGTNDFKIQYQRQQEPGPDIEFVFKDKALYVYSEDTTQLFAHQQELPADYEKLVNQSLKQLSLPDTLDIDGNNYQRVKPTSKTGNKIKIDPKGYFKADKADDQQPQMVITEPPL